MINKTKVKNIYVFKEKNQIYAHLYSDEWDFKNYGPVNLWIDNKKFIMRYIGFGNHNGTPVAVLAFEDQTIKSIEEITKVQSSDIYLERVIELN